MNTNWIQVLGIIVSFCANSFTFKEDFQVRGPNECRSDRIKCVREGVPHGGDLVDLIYACLKDPSYKPAPIPSPSPSSTPSPVPEVNNEHH